jgi:CAAX prenyl protease-like protein
MPSRRKITAYTVPMLLFVTLMVLNMLLHKIDNNAIWLNRSEYWIYPLQTLLCASALIYFWREYELHRPVGMLFGIVIGVTVFVIWISPQQFFGFAPRHEGFNPISMFGNQSPLYWPTVIFRFVRLVIVVPLVEEIFWRGFLLRYLIAEDFERIPFGKFSRLSFTAVTLLFALSHSKADWAAALLSGALYNFVAYRTKSLSSCVFAHALTNLLLGLWIMKTGQWGFW